jgi:hypothetical protein
VFAGRDAELDAIGAAVMQAAAGTPTLALIEGEPGGGKTALLQALEASPILPRRRIRVATLDLAVADADDAVARAARLLTSYGALARVGGRKRFAAAIRRVMPDWIGAIPIWGDLLEAITTTAAVIRRRRKRAPEEKLPEDIAELHRSARRRAAAVLIDNAHLAGPVAADRLHHLIGAAETGTRLIVIAAYRPASPGAPPPEIARPTARLPPDRRTSIALRPLGREAVAALLQSELAGSVSSVLLDDVMEVSGGLPAAVRARMDALRSSDALAQTEQGWIVDSAAAPESASDEVIDLGPLGADVALALTEGAVLGDEFAAVTLAQVLGRDELWVEDRLAAATRLGVLHLVDAEREVAGDITSVYRFASAATRAALRRQRKGAA